MSRAEPLVPLPDHAGICACWRSSDEGLHAPYWVRSLREGRASGALTGLRSRVGCFAGVVVLLREHTWQGCGVLPMREDLTSFGCQEGKANGDHLAGNELCLRDLWMFLGTPTCRRNAGRSVAQVLSILKRAEHRSSRL